MRELYVAYLKETFPSEHMNYCNLDVRTACAQPSSSLSRFLESEEYRRWVCAELGVPPIPSDEENAELVSFLLGLPRINDEHFKRLTADLRGLIGNMLECQLFFAESGWFRTFVSLAEGFPAIVSLATLGGSREDTVVYANNFTFEYTGYGMAEIIGRRCKLRLEEDAQHAVHRIAPVRAVVSCRRKDGSTVPKLLMSKPLLNARGECKFVVTIMTETVTDMNSFMGDFIANIPNVVSDE